MPASTRRKQQRNNKSRKQRRTVSGGKKGKAAKRKLKNIAREKNKSNRQDQLNQNKISKLQVCIGQFESSSGIDENETRLTALKQCVVKSWK
jgi:hypothetical protein